jgi:hypothetical protein
MGSMQIMDSSPSHVHEFHAMKEQTPFILTDEDFIDGHLIKCEQCTLVVAHADLANPIPDQANFRSDGRTLLEIARASAGQFPELRIGLLNCLTYPETAEQLSVYVSEYGTQCAALIFTKRYGPHCVVAGPDNTPQSFHQWVRGILLGAGGRPVSSRDDIVIRLAYDLALSAGVNSPDPQWDDPEVQNAAILAAGQTLVPLYQAWTPRFDDGTTTPNWAKQAGYAHPLHP